jgi:hypothetical protein
MGAPISRNSRCASRRLALPGSLVALQAGEFSALDVEEGLVALRARHLEPGVGFGDAASISFIAWTRCVSRRARIRVR